MSLYDLTYQRKGGIIPLRSTIRASVQKKGSGNSKNRPSGIRRKKLPRNYLRGGNELSQRIFFIISGGTERERAYLLALEKERISTKLKIVFISSDKGLGGLTPVMMRERAKQILKTRKVETREGIYHLCNMDSVYLVSDVDHYLDDLKRFVPNEKEFHWIISNPAFEIWLYYSYFNNPAEDLAAVVEAKESVRSRTLKEVNSSLIPGGIDPRKAFEHISEAISNSSSHYYADKYGIPELLSTQMHELAIDILEELGGEFSVWLARKNDQNRRYKSGLP